jgi:CheY-like chemotaxis protein
MGAVSQSAGTSSKGRVVIVDDEEGTRALLITALIAYGYEAFGAKDGLEALHLFDKQGIPDAVLLDLSMPHMNGWQVLDKFWEREELARMPVIIVTGHKDAHVPQADAFLVKPVDVEELIATIEEQIAQSEN